MIAGLTKQVLPSTLTQKEDLNMISPFGRALLDIGSQEIDNITHLTNEENRSRISHLYANNCIEVVDLLHDVHQKKVSLIPIGHTTFSVRFTHFAFPVKSDLAIFTGAFDRQNKTELGNQCMLILTLKNLINVLYFIPPDNLQAKELRVKSKTSNIYYPQE